jgi:hypothetical protein
MIWKRLICSKEYKASEILFGQKTTQMPKIGKIRENKKSNVPQRA